MIRNYKEFDLEEMVRLWYKASITAHVFVPASFWAAQRNYMKEKYLPLAENFVFEEEGKIKGFISLVGNKVCALFVAQESQGQGIGKLLLEYAKNMNENLELKAYKENKRAFNFYKKSGFKVVREEIDEYTERVQFLMEWRQSN
jgi:putative acetyltransferase